MYLARFLAFCGVLMQFCFHHFVHIYTEGWVQLTRVAIITKCNFRHCADANESWHAVFVVYHPLKCAKWQIACSLLSVPFGAICCRKNVKCWQLSRVS